MTTRKPAARFLASFAIASLLLAGCTDGTSAPKPPTAPERWPANLSSLHFVWTAEPPIDVSIQPAVTVRAYIESVLLASFGGSLNFLYPAFDQAVAADGPVDSPVSAGGLWPDPKKSPDVMVGTDYVHILRIAQGGRDVTAVACRWTYGSAWLQPNGMYRIESADAGPTTGLIMERVNLVAPADPSATQLPPQKGPSLYAMSDVFSGWRVVGRLQAFTQIDAGPEWPEFGEDQAACAARAPESVERREYLTSADRPRSDFPTLPASPGWPVESQ
jgi:hypothetical protein